MNSARETRAFDAGAAGGLPTGNSPEEMAAYNAGLLQWQARGGAAPLAAGGLVALIPALLLALPALVIGTCLFPLAGLLTAISGAMISGLLDDARVGTLVMLAAVLVPCIAVFAASMLLEKRLEQFRGYRLARHIARIAAVGFVAHVIVFAFGGAGRFRPDTSFLDRISVVHVFVVLAAMVGAHFASKALDAQIGDVEGFMARFRLRRLPGMALIARARA